MEIIMGAHVTTMAMAIRDRANTAITVMAIIRDTSVAMAGATMTTGTGTAMAAAIMVGGAMADIDNIGITTDRASYFLNILIGKYNAL